jgi:NADH-quinone oxidoreductase subunit M
VTLSPGFGALLLQLVLWLPLVGGIVVALAGSGPLARHPDAHADHGEPPTGLNLRPWRLATGFALVTFLLAAWLMLGFDRSQASQYQFVVRIPWLPFGSDYRIGVDGLSMPLVVLNALLSLSAIAGSWRVPMRQPLYYSLFLTLESAVAGVFTSVDLFLFFLFWELELIPMFLIIGIWGGVRREYAAFKFILYTVGGSAFMLLGIFLVAFFGHNANQPLTFGIPEIAGFNFAQYGTGIASLGGVAFILLFIGFAVKVPIFPLHTWLPDAHVEAPTGGSVVLAAVMLKIGGYGFLRFSLPIVPDASEHFAWLVIVLSLIAVVYIGYVALVQDDMKKLVAYSSVAHMGFVTLGIFIAFMLVRDANNLDAAKLGMQGAMVQMISHGFVSGAMFSCIGVMYDRLHTRQIKDYGGVINVMPWFGFFYVLFAMANSGLPGTSGFVGEFMVVLASFAANPWIALFAAFTLIIGAAYTLWMVKRVLWGDITNPHVREMKEINGRETFVLAAFALAVLALGIWPQPLIHLMDASVSQLVQQLAVHKI